MCSATGWWQTILSPTTSTLFSPQAHHKHFLRDVLLDCAFTTDLISSSVNHIPITIATGNSISSFVGFFELLHYILIKSRTYFVGQDSQCFPFEIHICWKSLREYKKGSTFLSIKQRSLGRRFSLGLHSLLSTWVSNQHRFENTQKFNCRRGDDNNKNSKYSPRNRHVSDRVGEVPCHCRIDQIRLQEERG